MKQKLLLVAGMLIFGLMALTAARAGERGLPPGMTSPDSPAVRDVTGKDEGRSIRQRFQERDRATASSRQDNSRYSTDGVERYDDDSGKDYRRSGPKREGRP